MILDPQKIADCFTLEEINAKILEFMGNPSGVKISDLDTTQGRQKIEYHAAVDRTKEFNSWLTAKSILMGTAGPKIYAGRYAGTS